MKTNLPSIKEFYNHKYVKAVEWKNLVLFHYTNECTYDRGWDDVTLNARGIIFNKVTGELVARPWKKFFNLHEVSLAIPQNDIFYVLDKWDGSMGILYKYEGEYYIATKGSFTSEQAVWATAWAKKNMRLDKVEDGFTYLFEIIYPTNKIVIDYGDMEDLVLIGVIDKANGEEAIPGVLNEYANILNVKCAKDHSFKSLDELSFYCKTLPSQREGFVVTFPSTGLKVKVKGDEYLRIHKIISNLTALAFWEAWDVVDRKIPDFYLQQMPDEFRKFTDEMAEVINRMHMDYYVKVRKEYDLMLTKHLFDENGTEIFWHIKDFAIECQKNHKENMSLLINLFKKQEDKLFENIHKRVRPDANVLPDGYKVECDIHGRLDRVLDDGA